MLSHHLLFVGIIKDLYSSDGHVLYSPGLLPTSTYDPTAWDSPEYVAQLVLLRPFLKPVEHITLRLVSDHVADSDECALFSYL